MIIGVEPISRILFSIVNRQGKILQLDWFLGKGQLISIKYKKEFKNHYNGGIQKLDILIVLFILLLYNN